MASRRIVNHCEMTDDDRWGFRPFAEPGKDENVRQCLIRCLAIATAVVLTQGVGFGQGAMSVIKIDPSAEARPFPHFWEQMFGSGHANLTLRESWRIDARALKGVSDFSYVRFHAIFDDKNGVYSEDQRGNPLYNWSYIDQIYDGLLENGIRPFVELSFMPSALAVSQNRHAFWYEFLPNPPRSYEKWGTLIEAFVRHLVERYGADEVRQWYFEVWNEPNLDFWTGRPAQATYFRLYDMTARAVKLVDSRLRVGGPATAEAAWVGEFVRHCTEERIPVDFVSTHVYGNDPPKKVLHSEKAVPLSEMVSRAARNVYDEVKASARPELPILWSEYNVTDMLKPEITDSAFMGPWLANNIRLCDGLTSMMSYWTFSDVFEEQGVVKTPFHGGYGLIAAGGIPKASFNAFALLHRLGEARLEAALDSVLVTKHKDGSLAIAAWNYAEPGQGRETQSFAIEVPNRSVAELTIIDEEHGSSLQEWKRMGAPAFPSREQQQRLRAAGGLPASRPLALKDGMFHFALAPHGLALVEIKP